MAGRWQCFVGWLILLPVLIVAGYVAAYFSRGKVQAFNGGPGGPWSMRVFPSRAVHDFFIPLGRLEGRACGRFMGFVIDAPDPPPPSQPERI
jgi:hypothetical protein